MGNESVIKIGRDTANIRMARRELRIGEAGQGSDEATKQEGNMGLIAGDQCGLTEQGEEYPRRSLPLCPGP